MLVLGVDGPAATPRTMIWRSPEITGTRCPSRFAGTCPILDRLSPITQKHSIEGLLMGAA